MAVAAECAIRFFISFPASLYNGFPSASLQQYAKLLLRLILHALLEHYSTKVMFSYLPNVLKQGEKTMLEK